jgi:hypothetical protein
MMRLFAILALCLLVGSSGQAQSTKDEIHMRATVRDVAPLAEFSGRVIAVDGDPRFALTVRIESVDPADGNFAVGTDVVFAIHSPAMLFATGPTIGKTYDFSVQREVDKGKTTYFGLKLERSTKGPRQFSVR